MKIVDELELVNAAYSVARAATAVPLAAALVAMRASNVLYVKAAAGTVTDSGRELKWRKPNRCLERGAVRQLIQEGF